MFQLLCSPDLRYQAVHAPGEMKIYKDGKFERSLPPATLPPFPFALARGGQIFFRTANGVIRNRAEHGQHYEAFPFLKDQKGQLGTIAVALDGARVLYERQVEASGLMRLVKGEQRELVLVVLGQPQRHVFYSGAPGFHWAVSPDMHFLVIAEKGRKGWKAQVIDTVLRKLLRSFELPGEVSTLWVGDGGELLVESDQLWIWPSSDSAAPLTLDPFPGQSVMAFGGDWIGLRADQEGRPGYVLYSLKSHKVAEAAFVDGQGGVERSGRRPR